MARDPVTARGRVLGFDAVQANNLEEFPIPKLPTYEGLPECVEGTYVTHHVSVPGAGIDYVKHAIAGFDVDPTTVVVLS